jgi:DNA-binding NarL/FixJ family response regulator
MERSWKHKSTAVLIDDHSGVLMAACEIMKDEFDIMAVVLDGDAALDAVSIFSPDVVLHIGMPEKDGFETVRRLRETDCAIRVVFLTVMEDIDYVCAVREAGGSYVAKRRMRTDLLSAARDAMRGNLFFSPILPTESHLS